MKTVTLSLGCTLIGAAQLFALTASDDASNYVTWNDTDNQGTGFLSWSLQSDGGTGGFAGHFIGDSTAGASDINTGGASFGMFANGAGDSSVEAIRSFSTSLTTNDLFTFDMAMNFNDGNRGFNLRTGGTNIIGLNIFSGDATINTAFTNNATVDETFDFGGTAMLEVVIQILSPSSLTYQISRDSSEGNQGILFAGTVSDIVGNIDNFNFYINGDASGGSGAADNLYFNSLSVSEVPEPSAFALLAGVAALAFAGRRRR